MRLHSRSLTKLLQRPPRPGIPAFAIIGGIEAVVRGIALSVYPLLMYRAWGDAVVVSQMYFGVGVFSLLTGLAVPLLTRHVPRRFVYSMGALLMCSRPFLASWAAR